MIKALLVCVVIFAIIGQGHAIAYDRYMKKVDKHDDRANMYFARGVIAFLLCLVLLLVCSVSFIVHLLLLLF